MKKGFTSALKLPASRAVSCVNFFRRHFTLSQHADKKASVRGFTLIELLVVIAIIGLLSSVVLASLNSARMKARDAQRVSTMRELQNALALYYDSNNSTYPAGTWANDCSGDTSWQTVLQPLVTGNFMSRLPHDPAYPSGTWPQCYYYEANWSCNRADTGIVYPYILIFHSESATLPFDSWNGESNRWCLHP